MQGKWKIRGGLVMVTLSSIILLISVILTISGYLHAMQVIYTESDLILDDERNLTMEYSSDSFEILIFNIDSEEAIEFELVVLDSSGNRVFDKRDQTLSMINVPLTEKGDYEILIDIIDDRDNPLDLTIEVMKTGPVFMYVCMSVMCLSVIFLPLLIIGGLATITGSMDMRERDRRYQR